MLKTVIFVLFLTSTSQAIPFTDCGGTFNLNSVDIENCKYLPCPLFMLDSTKVTVNMSAGFQARNVIQNITITTKTIKTATYSTPGPCTKERPCPTGPGDVSFTTKLYVPDIAPFPSLLKWLITDNYGRKLMCFSTDVYLCDKGSDERECYQ